MELLDDTLSAITATQNQALFSLRNFLKRGKGKYQETSDPLQTKQALFSGSPETDKQRQRLLETYRLADFERRANRLRYLDVLTYLSYLEAFEKQRPFIQPRPDQTLYWLDVGAKNWSYVDALFAYLQQAAGPHAFHLEGIELDAYRRYTDGHCRAEYAQSYIDHLPSSDFQNAEYFVGDILDWQGACQQDKYQVISCFLPFVFKDPCLAWGLPDKYFQPQAFLTHLFWLLADHGTLLLVNQGQDEAQEQARLLQQVKQQWPGLGITITPIGLMPNPFSLYEQERYGFLCQKQST